MQVLSVAICCTTEHEWKQNVSPENDGVRLILTGFDFCDVEIESIANLTQLLSVTGRKKEVRCLELKPGVAQNSVGLAWKRV
ncbi:unnamed protein product [Sphenostylis stenocarpa]|uniref:Uncharacterized protein n=1 Tax=Sphenostylis stenocarpa TaxID=92480 RepID=A0AA86SLL7_9FABA|nr:unnamed protein product [Sphenostylis stenocarpa]